MKKQTVSSQAVVKSTLSSLTAQISHKAWAAFVVFLLAGGNAQALSQPSTIADDGSYNAFPGITVDADGSLIVVYRKGATHASDQGSIVSKRSRDGGRSWSDETTVFHDSEYDSRDPSITMLANGNLLVSFFKYSVPSGRPIDAFTVASSDHGATWKAAVRVGGYKSYGAVSAPVVELANGELLLATYGQDDVGMSVKVHHSTDGGRAWSVLSVLAAKSNYTEPILLVLRNKDVLITARNELTGFFATATSRNNGSGWTEMADRFPAVSRASVIQLTNGTLLSAYRSNSEPNRFQLGMNLSSDDGLTWMSNENVLPAGEVMEYAAFAPLRGSAGMVYCAQQSASKSSCWFAGTADFCSNSSASGSVCGALQHAPERH